MQGIHTYIPEKNYVPRKYSVAAIILLLLLFLYVVCVLCVVLFLRRWEKSFFLLVMYYKWLLIQGSSWCSVSLKIKSLKMTYFRSKHVALLGIWLFV